jgi:hypothetical protein
VHGPEKHGLSYTGPFIKKHFFSIFLTFLWNVYNTVYPPDFWPSSNIDPL